MCAHVHANTVTNHLFYSLRDIRHNENETVLIINLCVRHFSYFFFFNNQNKRTNYTCVSLSSPQKFAKFLQISPDIHVCI